MQRFHHVLVLFVLTLGLFAWAHTQMPAPQKAKWDCSVEVAEASDAGHYVITYCNERVTPSSSSLTVQNQNDFDIVIHLSAAGETELTAAVHAGGLCIFKQLTEGIDYQVGIHADLPENTRVAVIVYDGAESALF